MSPTDGTDEFDEYLQAQLDLLARVLRQEHKSRAYGRQFAEGLTTKIAEIRQTLAELDADGPISNGVERPNIAVTTIAASAR